MSTKTELGMREKSKYQSKDQKQTKKRKQKTPREKNFF